MLLLAASDNNALWTQWAVGIVCVLLTAITAGVGKMISLLSKMQSAIGAEHEVTKAQGLRLDLHEKRLDGHDTLIHDLEVRAPQSPASTP